MAIDPEAINNFLNRPLAERPTFKGADPDELLRMIYNTTGAYYKEVTKSRPHQLEGVAFALYMQRALLFYWMRLGKSKIALDWAAQLKRANIARKKGLILAHAPIGAQVWLSQAAQHSTLTAKLVASGPSSQDDFIAACLSDCDLIIMSISTMQQLFSVKRFSKKKEANKLYADHQALEIAASFFDHAIIDETHFYANPFGLPFTLAAGLVEGCRYRIGLTGTPIGRKPFAIWSQAFLIDGGKHFGRAYKFFEFAFGRKEQYSRNGFTLAFDKRKMPLFQYKVDALALSYGKDEVRSAEVFSGIVELTMGDEQAAAYDRMVDGLLKLRLDETVEVEAIFTKLRMIASGYVPFVDEQGAQHIIHFANSVKLAWLREFVAELEPGMQCLIFHEYIHTGELICKTLDECKITNAWLHGDTKNKPVEIARFKSGAAQILVANAATGGTSIDLPQADYLCFFESPCSPITRAQAQARPMARGDRPLIIDDLVCAPIEDKILDFINEGDNLLSTVLRGSRKSAAELLRAKK